MKIHEYQAKGLLVDYGIPVPRGRVARAPDEAGEIAAELEGKVVVKAQVHAGGRGKAGGIEIAEHPAQAKEIAESLLGKRLVTRQTGPEGVLINAVLVEEALEVQRELYVGVVVDSARGMPLVMASEAGGMGIEEIAARSPEKILEVAVDPLVGFQPFMTRRLAFGLKLEGASFKQAARIFPNLYRLFWSKDCSLAEVNPLVVTPDGRLFALDAKMNFDDNALYRHSDIAEMRDVTQEDAAEVEARNMGIGNYVKMDGSIGIMVNGAGLAMSVMDTLNAAGGRAANFLDTGTVNDLMRVVNSFKVLVADPNVECVLVNIFGGMARVDIIAAGIVEAYKQMDIEVPVVVRLAGTNLAEGERILAQSGLNLIRAATFREAVEKAVAVVGG